MKEKSFSEKCLDRWKTTHPTVYKACVTSMRNNSGKRASQIEFISFNNVDRALEKNVPENIVAKFITKPLMLKQLLKHCNKIILNNETIVNQLLEIQADYLIVNAYKWLLLKPLCNTSLILQSLHLCDLEHVNNRDIKSLNKNDFEHIHRIIQDKILEVKWDSHSYISTNYIKLYIEFKKHNVDITYIDKLIPLAKPEYIDLYFHVIKHYKDDFDKIADILTTNLGKFDFHSATLAITCPGLFRGQSSQISKINNSILLAIVEVHYRRTGEIVTFKQLETMRNILNREHFISKEVAMEDECMILVNFIISGMSILTYADLGLESEALINIFKQGANLKSAFEECKKYNLVSFKTPELLPLREEMIRASKEKVIS